MTQICRSCHSNKKGKFPSQEPFLTLTFFSEIGWIESQRYFWPELAIFFLCLLKNGLFFLWWFSIEMDRFKIQVLVSFSESWSQSHESITSDFYEQIVLAYFLKFTCIFTRKVSLDWLLDWTSLTIVLTTKPRKSESWANGGKIITWNITRTDSKVCDRQCWLLTACN